MSTNEIAIDSKPVTPIEDARENEETLRMKEPYFKDNSYAQKAYTTYETEEDEKSYSQTMASHTSFSEEIARFCTDRELNKQPFDSVTYQTNVVEELLELDGYGVPKEKRLILQDKFQEFMKNFVEQEELEVEEYFTEEDAVDAVADVIVLSHDALLKLGYKPELVLSETARVINSREGSIIDGKFIKFTTPEAKEKWHSPLYRHARKSDWC